MDINRAKYIVSALAEGIDPTTGEVLSDDNICNKGEVVRAFYAILNAFEDEKDGNDKTMVAHDAPNRNRIKGFT